MQDIVLKVNGMMCSGCEKRVQNVVSSIENVKEVKADHEKGTVTIKVDVNVNIDEIKSAIRDLEYEVE
ncbi:MAG: heavy-metal-associated domain-containing protein [Clostridia bacterium]|nr:heavy-metal-associated domain-containing protein [Clostridia bacterium]